MSRDFSLLDLSSSSIGLEKYGSIINWLFPDSSTTSARIVACAQGSKVLYFNARKLLVQTKMVRLDGSIFKLFQRIAKADLLILDDFGLAHLDKKQQMDLMEIIEDRHANRSTIIASQLPVKNWYEIIGEATIADAILDRLVHTSHRIELKGESLRKKL
jgi:DNA replication protein DnaC